MSASRTKEALGIADKLLEDIEMGRIDALDAVRRAIRIARLINDAGASDWLLWELQGYPAPNGRLDERARLWAYMSGRCVDAREAGSRWAKHPTEESVRVNVASLSRLKLVVSTAAPFITPTTQASPAVAEVFRELTAAQRILQDVLTAIHLWVGGVHDRLQFGAAVETAFGVVKTEVDRAISELVPDATSKLSAAFENVTSDNSEDWASAAATCRRLLKAAADSLRPPGPDVAGRKMGDAQYVNRLINWIEKQSPSETRSDLIAADLTDLARRLEAVTDAGNKGAHDEVDRFDASRFVMGTYLLLGDILRLRADAEDAAMTDAHDAVPIGSSAPRQNPDAVA